jgi:hypothetical protein
VALSEITRDEVLEAIGEYDRLGQDDFLERYGFDRARLYLLLHDGKPCDSKAIVGAAHGFLPEQRPLTAGEFSGGEATVGRLLRRLGFTIQPPEIAASGTESMMAFLKAQTEGSSRLWVSKLLVVGEGGVGNAPPATAE